jgi:2',3'-cyclic-nucleotide 2'-phosphodiesterase
MKILFVGDVVGRSGRRLVRDKLPTLQANNRVDFTIVNVENAAGGFGITKEVAREILSSGVDVMTTGNHVWDKSEAMEYLNQEPRLLRPGNYPQGAPGSGLYLGETPAGTRVAVINIQGRVFMPLIDCPFNAVQKDLQKLKRETTVIVVDFHAEATSEKQAMGWYLDGQVTAVVGTHTHVPTADTRVLPKGTAYVSDVGMTGPFDSIIGMKVENSLARFLTGLPSRFEPASEYPRLCSVLIDVDESTGLARSIRRIDVDG